MEPGSVNQLSGPDGPLQTALSIASVTAAVRIWKERVVPRGVSPFHLIDLGSLPFVGR